MRGISRMTSSHMALVSVSSVPLKVRTSWLPAPRPVPNSNRPSERWSIIAARSAMRTGWSLLVGNEVMAEPTWICLVRPATYPITGYGADMWLYSVSPWCSPNQAYFQLWRSPSTAYSASRMSIRCSESGSCAAGPGRYPLKNSPNSMSPPRHRVGRTDATGAVASEQELDGPVSRA